MIVFAVYPRFVAQRHERVGPAWALSLASSGLAIYGIAMALQQTSG